MRATYYNFIDRSLWMGYLRGAPLLPSRFIKPSLFHFTIIERHCCRLGFRNSSQLLLYFSDLARGVHEIALSQNWALVVSVELISVELSFNLRVINFRHLPIN